MRLPRIARLLTLRRSRDDEPHQSPAGDWPACPPGCGCRGTDYSGWVEVDPADFDRDALFPASPTGGASLQARPAGGPAHSLHSTLLAPGAQHDHAR